MRRIGSFGALVIATFVMASPACAYTAEQARLCTSDAFRLCGSAIPDVEQITICMRRQKSKLSAGCKSVFDKPPLQTTSARD